MIVVTLFAKEQALEEAGREKGISGDGLLDKLRKYG